MGLSKGAKLAVALLQRIREGLSVEKLRSVPLGGSIGLWKLEKQTQQDISPNSRHQFMEEGCLMKGAVLWSCEHLPLDTSVN